MARSKQNGKVGWFIFVILALIYFAIKGDSGDNKAVANESDDLEYTYIYNAKEAVLSRLKDPDSAEFRNVYYNNSPTTGHAVCGEVNAKNSFGGFTGFTRFVSKGISSATFLESEVTDFETVWRTICR